MLACSSGASAGGGGLRERSPRPPGLPCAGARGPEHVTPRPKLPGKLEQPERAGASLLHNSRAAGRGGRSPAPARLPDPAAARGGQEPGVWGGLCVTPGTRVPDSGFPGSSHGRRPGPSRARCSRRAHLYGGFGGQCRAGAAGSPDTLRPKRGSPPPSAPWRPRTDSSSWHAGPGHQASGQRPRTRRTQAGVGLR